MNVCMNDDAGDDSGVAAIVVVSIAGSVKVYEPCDVSRPCRHGKHLRALWAYHARKYRQLSLRVDGALLHVENLLDEAVLEGK